jgi:hypothetical protein
MSTRIIISACCIMFFLSFCKKNIDITYKTKYVKSDARSTGLIRYFSSNGEINVNSIPPGWIGQDTDQLNYYLDNFRQQGYFDTLMFISDQEAIFKIYTIETKYNARKDGTKYILERSEITTQYSGHDEFTRSPHYYLLLYKPTVIDEWIYSSVRGDYVFGYRAKPIAPLAESDGKLLMPLILFRQRRKGLPINSSYLTNQLENNFYKNIIAGDTVCLREAQAIYEKK